jgi:multiple sugar transport system permease protein
MSEPVISTIERAVPASSRRLGRQARENLKGYLFVSPWILSLLVFTAYPMIASFYFAMTKYSILNPPTWVGWGNFQVMFATDPYYWKSVWNTVYYVIVSVPLGIGIGLVLALLLDQRIGGIGIYRTLYYLPGLVPAVASTLLWMVLLDPRLGLVNMALRLVGLRPVGWLRSAAWSKPALILMSLWGGSGGTMLIFLASLKEIPQSLLEAAMIDGANGWQRFWNVKLPLLTPTVFFNLIMGIIGSFQVFASAFVAGSGEGGPLNSILVYMLHLYRNAFRYFNMGYASAMALAMFAVLVALTLVLIRSSNYWVFYQAAGRR